MSNKQIKIEIRRLQPGDEQIALQVVRHLMPVDERNGREPSIHHLKRMLRQDTNYLLIAAMDSTPVAFLTAYRLPALCCDASMVYIFEIEVDPAYQRQGIGKQLISLLKTVCRESDVEDIWVGTDNDNVGAKQLYASTGGICVASNNCEFVYYL